MTVDCTNPRHDHQDPDGNDDHCNDCGLPMHYDRDLERFVHDDPDATCFLIQTRPVGASACWVEPVYETRVNRCDGTGFHTLRTPVYAVGVCCECARRDTVHGLDTCRWCAQLVGDLLAL